MRSPRFLLILLATQYALVAWHTWGYPPDYLAFSWLWATLAGVAAVVTIGAAVKPKRHTVAASGALLVTVAVCRSLAITSELVTRSFPADQRAAFIIAAATWVIVAALVNAEFRNSVIPWSLTRGRR